MLSDKAAYRACLDEILAQIQGSAGVADITTIYRRVRNIPYGGAGQRDPRLVYERNMGTCSGKHILLRDLLRAAEYEADVITIFTHFNKLVPVHESMPDELQRIITNTDVPDFHHFVNVHICGIWLRLDATWPDHLRRYGFPVNDEWNGHTDTILAGTPLRIYAASEDIVSLKSELLKTIPEPELRHRARFLELLSAWLAMTSND